jgi:hypothetical protein
MEALSSVLERIELEHVAGIPQADAKEFEIELKWENSPGPP